MKKLVVGILAHVDAGKTTLSEALLYQCGCLRRLGRVDHANAFLDTDPQERERGITIFSKQALLPLPELEITLMDTPGHADFSAEMERTLSVLDYAILVVSGANGVQGHTETLWRLLARYQIPVLLFVNKMDLVGTDQVLRLSELQKRLHMGCIDFTPSRTRTGLEEDVALCDETVLSQYLEDGMLSDGVLADSIANRSVFPVWFGSALRLEGVEDLLEGLVRYTRIPHYPAEFAARVYKIARDGQGARLTYLKVTGGTLRMKTMISGTDWEEKVDQLRIYSGVKYKTVEAVPAGAVCAVIGLSATHSGEGLGGELDRPDPVLRPVLTYEVILPQGVDPHSTFTTLRGLEEEDPQLYLIWNAQLRKIQVQLMGPVQLEVLARLILDRFGLAVTFGMGAIVYRETIAAPVEGVGHYEPLRHYAEVHLLLEPGPRGSGLRFTTDCPEVLLDRVWQRLILTHLEERPHLGVLTGAPLTDVMITLVAGKAHIKHTEGGDFRQATYRAVRQGLMRAESLLLEPWYDLRLQVPEECVGRAMTDLQRIGGTCTLSKSSEDDALLTGAAPVAALGDYAAEVMAYTRGRGHLSYTLRGYEPCVAQEALVSAMGYEPQRDPEHSPDSVFCTHGAGFSVPWNEVEAYMHLPALPKKIPELPAESFSQSHRRDWAGVTAEDRELTAIFERTYGPVKRRELFQSPPKVQTEEAEKYSIVPPDLGPEYLLVDGYNIIFAWDELKNVAEDSLDTARQLLMDLLSNYQGLRQCIVILVFDAYRVPKGRGEKIAYHNIHVVYTKQAETADAYIERTTYGLAKRHRVRVATSDGVEQLIILGHGALRLSARAFHDEVQQMTGQLTSLIAKNNRRAPSQAIRTAMERAKSTIEDL